ncbi:Retrotransposable element SLACS 132 kDa protein (ORF2) [Includes: Reverse transcriptase] [Durusdinium trenchii]|uniref:Retrotransposable element SLACS 132 kDa protein (ORF2) n=1 Tax=Durusdinium trenchii TaxID=1381693 RepID=A0ABP0HLE7_9DINO
MPYAQQSHYTPSQPAPTRPLRGRVAHTTSPGPDADTFSWFDVQLLLAATNRLEPPAFEAWQQTATAGNPWRRLQLFEQFFQRRFHRYNLQCNKYPPTRRTKPGTDNINTTQHEPAPSPPPAIPSPSGNPGRRGVDLQTALKINFTGFQSPPAFVKGRVRQALGLALETIQRADTQQQSVRAWKLWLLLPRMLLHRPPGVRTLPKTEWHTRITAFQAGDWLALLRAAQPNTCPPGKKRRRLTAETLRFILDDESITNTFVAVATRRPPRNQCSTEGRLVALSKPNGRVRGFVVGDLLRRVVARTLAQQHALTFQQACSPHQYALSTRAGSEAVVHAITSLTELDPTNTILSIDGVGAYDTIARSSMLQALAEVEGTNTCLAFVRQFYATTSTYIWHDHNGQPHEVSQAEGGEQGDPLMPALFSLGQRTALQTVHSNLEPGETLFAFLDDVYVVLPPHRVRPVYDLPRCHYHLRMPWADAIPVLEQQAPEAFAQLLHQLQADDLQDYGWQPPEWQHLADGRLRLPLPLFARFCRCRRTLDSLGDHRVACAQSGLLRARGGPLERAAARIWGGNQLAVDTTLLSPLTREGVPRQRGGTFAGTALGDARRRKEHTYPELLRSRRCKLVVLGLEVGGRWSEETASFIKLLAQHKARHAKPRHSSNTLYHNSINRQVVSTFDP